MAKRLGKSKGNVAAVLSDFSDGPSIDVSDVQMLAAALGVYIDGPEVDAMVDELLRASGGSGGTVLLTEVARRLAASSTTGAEAGVLLKTSMQTKLLLRNISRGLRKRPSPGRLCHGAATVTVGRITPEASRGMLKQFVRASSPEVFAALDPPHSAAMAFVLDLTLRADAAVEAVQETLHRAEHVFEVWGAPAMAQLPRPARKVGEPEAELYVGHR